MNTTTDIFPLAAFLYAAVWSFQYLIAYAAIQQGNFLGISAKTAARLALAAPVWPLAWLVLGVGAAKRGFRTLLREARGLTEEDPTAKTIACGTGRHDDCLPLAVYPRHRCECTCHTEKGTTE